MNEDLSYPIGRFDRSAPVTPEMRESAISTIAGLPSGMRAVTSDLSENQLDSPYRPGGWTVRQLVHHVADSHMNGYVRMKLGLTEDHPTIRLYDQDEWSRLADVRLPIAVSLTLLDALHERWARVWRSLDAPQLSRTFVHPELGSLTLDTHLQLYAWHSRHHVAHISALRGRERW